MFPFSKSPVTLRLFAIGVLTLVSTAALRAADGDQDEIDFNRDVRPIIFSNCVSCHGPDEHDRKADLRLDTFEGATANLDGHFAIKPGDLSASELIARVTATDPDDIMPPPKTGSTLSAEQVETLRRWIASGAEYEGHWAFTQPVRHDPPQVKDSAWPKNEIDYFVLSRLEKEGLAPSEEADRPTLIRRLYLDLIGLPPQPEDVEAFVNDNSPRAYEALVDRLLKDEAFGERWAAMWLDLARYADSMGYASDNLRSIWAYRDWVIHALNTNMPYDQFTLEQLAGDLLPNPTPEQLVATAFHRNTMNNTEGGTDNEEFRVAAVKDRTATTIQVWMGLTMKCAECHNHKYDPLSQKDYYALYDFFNQTADADTNDDAPTMPVPGTPELAKRQALDAQIAALKKQLRETDPTQLSRERHEWESQYRGQTEWRTLSFDQLTSIQGETLSAEKDGSLFVSGKGPKNDTYTLELKVPDARTITAFRLETIPDHRLPAGGSGRSPEGDFILSRFGIEHDTGGRPQQGRYVRVELPGDEKFVHLAEVEVYRGKTNIARAGTASQSSTSYDAPAERAIDGKTSGDFFKDQSVTHTAKEKNPWWEVDLGNVQNIDRIVLWNRTDGGTATRLEGYTIRLLDENRQTVWEQSGLKAPEKSEEFALSGVRQVEIAQATADFSQEDFPITDASKTVARNLSGWGVAPRQKEPHEALFVPAKAIAAEAGDTLKITLDHDYNYGGQRNLGRFRVSWTDDPAMAKRAELAPDILTIIDKPEKARTPAEVSRLSAYFLDYAPSLAKARTGIAKLEKQRKSINPPLVPVMVQLDTEKHRETHIQNRGNFMDLGDVVQGAVPESFNDFPKDAPRNRIGVAKWLTSPENPLTARVAVNRFWAQLFGIGLVETEEDFGTQGTYPSHPRLLDWMATEYVRLGWDTKAILKTMVMSATYRQTSASTPERYDADPDNRLLSRGPRFRLDAEMIRDQALAFSGLLTQKVGGPSVYPPQPPGMWRAAFNGKDRNWATSEGEDRYRRGLYTFWRRSVPYPSMATFDAPSRELCSPRRIRTNTPLQAFVTLNDPVYVEIAQALADRILAEGGQTDTDQIDFALRLVLTRAPRPEETQTITDLYQSELAYYQEHPEEAKAIRVAESYDLPKDEKLKAKDPKPKDKPIAVTPEQAAWTAVSNILLNLDAVLTKS